MIALAILTAPHHGASEKQEAAKTSELASK